MWLNYGRIGYGYIKRHESRMEEVQKRHKIRIKYSPKHPLFWSTQWLFSQFTWAIFTWASLRHDLLEEIISYT